MSIDQRHIARFLDAELTHSVGSYRLAHQSLGVLVDNISSTPTSAEPLGPYLARLARVMRHYNRMLDEQRHTAREAKRHPAPDRFLWSQNSRFGSGLVMDDKEPEISEPACTQWLMGYYASAQEALTVDLSGQRPHEPRQQWTRKTALRFLNSHLTLPREGTDLASLDADDRDRLRARLDGRQARYERRALRASACEFEAPDELESFPLRILTSHLRSHDPVRDPPEPDDDGDGKADAPFADEAEQGDGPELTAAEKERLVTQEWISASLPCFVLAALVEAHLAMHGVEALQSHSLKAHLERKREWSDRELDRSIALLTFVYSIARSCPWLFAENTHEADEILRTDSRDVWDRMTPTVCTWISAQIALLALHRRAFSWSLRGDKQKAYQDYHKLQRHIRDVGRRLRLAPINARGAFDFLDCLDALADYHIGELYREDQSHTTALVHFRRADAHLERLRAADRPGDQADLPIRDVLENSRWRIELLMGTGKACYEMGQLRESLGWHFKGWKAFLEMLAQDTGTTVNADPIDAAIAWVEETQHEPEIHKTDLKTYTAPVADQLRGIKIDTRLGILAADILTRIGHLIMILRVDHPSPPTDQPPHELELQFLEKALECDRANTLLAADILKVAYHLREKDLKTEGLRETIARLTTKLENVEPLQGQWPGGGGDFERFARAAEYVLLRELTRVAEADPAADESLAAEQDLARSLLVSMFMHTDSIHIRRLQVHASLDDDRAEEMIPTPFVLPVLEFACLRRFSSSFPLLPRPAAFRSLAGGYFLRVHRPPRNNEKRPPPFGIVIDPGSDFVENLFRSGYSMSDVDMIIVTHDHVDHMASLEPLLALQWERGELQGGRHPSVPILANESVLRRYRGVTQYSQLQFFSLCEHGAPRPWEEWDKFTVGSIADLNAQLGERLDLQIRFQAFSSRKHLDLCEVPSHGFRLQVGGSEGPSIGFMSDVPQPQEDAWMTSWIDLLKSEIVVAHVSALPIAELRKMAGLGLAIGAVTPEEARDRLTMNELFGRARNGEFGQNLAERLTYANWLGRYGDDDLPGLVGPDGLEDYVAPQNQHLFLRGLMEYATLARTQRTNRLFVIGEVSEELGSGRRRIAERVNAWQPPGLEVAPKDWKAVTADIGLKVLVGSVEPKATRPRVQVLCTTCDLDNDLARRERYHSPDHIHEVCVKGENEGIFYNCDQHDPTVRGAPTFIERLERYDIYGR